VDGVGANGGGAGGVDTSMQLADSIERLDQRLAGLRAHMTGGFFGFECAMHRCEVPGSAA
jgi:hypothetical protein